MSYSAVTFVPHIRKAEDTGKYVIAVKEQRGSYVYLSDEYDSEFGAKLALRRIRKEMVDRFINENFGR